MSPLPSQLQTLTDFLRLLGYISHPQHATGIGPDDLINLNKTLDSNKDLRELTLIEEKLQKAHVDPNHN